MNKFSGKITIKKKGGRSQKITGPRLLGNREYGRTNRSVAHCNWTGGRRLSAEIHGGKMTMDSCMKKGKKGVGGPLW